MAKATIGSLSAILSLNSTKFTKGINKATSRARAFGNDLARVAKRVAGFGAALTAIAGGAGLAVMVKQSMAAIDATAKMSDKLGIATEKLAGLQFAAKQSGVGVNTLNMGLQRMVRRIAEAAQDTGEAKDALAELGLSAQKLNELSPDKQFARIADAMEKVSNQGDRVRLGFKLFDSEGVALINTLRGGSRELERMQAELERLGGAFSRIDAAKIELANNAIGRMRTAVAGLSIQFSILASPILEAVANRFTAMTTAGESAGNKISAAFKPVIQLFAGIADISGFIMQGMRAMQGAIFKVISGLARAVQFIREFGDFVPSLFGRERTGAGAWAKNFADELSALGDQAFDKAAAWWEGAAQGGLSTKLPKLFNDLQKDIQRRAEALTKSLKMPDVSANIEATVESVKGRVAAPVTPLGKAFKPNVSAVVGSRSRLVFGDFGARKQDNKEFESRQQKQQVSDREVANLLRQLGRDIMSLKPIGVTG